MLSRSAILVSLIISFAGCTSTKESPSALISWNKLIREVGSFSSPRAVDLTGDGIKDIVFGAGKVEFQDTDSAVFALDGSNGSVLWMVGARDQIFGSPDFMDITEDGVPDVFIGGRSAEFMAIDGHSGQVIWEYFAAGDTVDFNEHKLYNFYNSQFIADMSGDGLSDLLVSNGGYVKAGPYELERPPGKLMIINAVNGQLIAEAYMPDGKETYFSAVIMDASKEDPRIIFGTGGERISGGLYVTYLHDIVDGTISEAIKIFDGKSKGFVAPPVVVDVNNDGALDIVVNAVDGIIAAFDGNTYQNIWLVDIEGTEIYGSLGVGYFDQDTVPDFYTNLGIGAFPDLLESVQIVINGKSGDIIRRDTIGAFHYASPVVYDIDQDNLDEVFFHHNYLTSGLATNSLNVIDIDQDSIYTFASSWRGANLGSTPLLDDLNGDGLLEIIAIHENNPTDLFSVEYKTGLEIHMIATEIAIRDSLKWGAYMGSTFTGRFQSKE